MEQTEYPPMSGNNTICVAPVLLKTGIVPMVEPVTELKFEAPAGLIAVTTTCRDPKVTQAMLRNLPAFTVHLDTQIKVADCGPAVADMAWGGPAWHVLCHRRGGPVRA